MRKILVSEVELDGSKETIVNQHLVSEHDALEYEWEARQKAHTEIAGNPLKKGTHYISSGRLYSKRNIFKELKLFVSNNVVSDQDFLDICYELGYVTAYHGGFVD